MPPAIIPNGGKNAEHRVAPATAPAILPANLANGLTALNTLPRMPASAVVGTTRIAARIEKTRRALKLLLLLNR
jgi:hypothetical protein